MLQGKMNVGSAVKDGSNTRQCDKEWELKK